MKRLARVGINYPRTTVLLICIVTLSMLTAVALPVLWPNQFSSLPHIKVDTDPENMLEKTEPVRVFHNRMKKSLNLYDMIVVGVVNTRHPNGVFNKKSLTNIYKLTEFAKKIIWQEGGKKAGVISAEILSPSTVDNIEQAGVGSVSFNWLMPKPPESDREALEIKAKAERLPLLNGTVVSEDGKAIALYIPITAKNVSYRVSQKLRTKIKELGGDDHYYITGLPVAQDTFGVEMFQQMAISAPLAMLIIFLLMWFFFKEIKLIISPMIVALCSVIITMGSLVLSGETIHIMSSMIPIFIMPIAVLDAIHILSDFFDRYHQTCDRKHTIETVMDELFAPMLYTSLTTFAGFASLALTPIPPVRVFGIFVSLGVAVAWVLTVVGIPAYIMLLKEESLKRLGDQESCRIDPEKTLMGRLLHTTGKLAYSYARAVIVLIVILGGVAYYGIRHIVINDNPVKWFSRSHEIRIADRELNKRFAGTYMAYLSLSASGNDDFNSFKQNLREKLLKSDNPASAALAEELDRSSAKDSQALIADLTAFAEKALDNASDKEWENWDQALGVIEALKGSQELFKQPEVLKYIEKLQEYLKSTGLVGKSNSLADIVKTVHRELLLGKASEFRIPDSKAAVAQTLLSFQNSHRPGDLFHFVTPDYRTTSLWIQLKSGDNRDMNAVAKAVEQFFKTNPAPVALKHKWFGLTYINVIWQAKMVRGMAEAFLSSFAVVLVLMVILFRSALWGVLAMVPLTVTIAVIYGSMGIFGKDYDMPVAVLSSLSLGLAVDYAIHFLARSRHLYSKHQSWAETIESVFGEPARAITRNVIVVGVGFLPLLAAPLVPYKTVGVFISTILILAGVATLMILPALMRFLEKFLFKSDFTADKTQEV
ncbi:MAG: RND transporter [Candidatus Dadabacteria bacterium]|nr:MAG: RND transporter [Candidatus Dadabacteria bacterium]